MNSEISPMMPEDVFDCLQEDGAKDKSYQIWVDGSYLDKDRNKAGIGVIVSEKDNKTPLFALAYNISNLKIRKSKYTELWAASLAMTDLKDLNIQKITCDSPITKHRIRNIREGITTALGQERQDLEKDETPELLKHLKRALSHHPGIHVSHVNRKTDNIPHSDRFSRNAAKRRLARIFSSAHELDVPCLYKIVNQDGEHRQAYFFDKMDNYDMDDYIEGSFQDDQDLEIS